MVKGQQAVLVDFDWCDKAGKGRYPPGINQEIIWPMGVGPGKIMLEEHDIKMLEDLQGKENDIEMLEQVD